MQQKTLKKIVRKFEVLPLHHIDTSIMLEPEKTESGRQCQKYLQRVGYNYRGRLSFPALSELFVSILRIENSDNRYTVFDLIAQIVHSRKIEFYAQKDTSGIIETIRTIDPRLTPLDREIVACAVEDQALVLATLDSELIHNQKIEQEFKIKIVHPKELL
ncbi:MAG: hypothetical protein HY832_02330 [Candidatus Aenigmarchaeota archaeon]|nr:hypothetical protein [Candidatus Aenigmarchaeota archaeon]